MPSCEPIPSLDSAREEWTRLAERSGSVFATWEWAEAWWRHFGEGREQALLRLTHGDGEPAAIAPLYVEQRGPLRVLRLIGGGPGDMLGPVCAPQDRGEAGAALLEGLREGAAGRWHVLLGERLPVGPLGEALGGRVLQREASPELPVEGRSWEEFLASKSRNIREKLGRNTRKLEREHELRYRLCEDPGRLQADFDTLVRLHAERWGSGGAFEREAVEAFHRDFAATALSRGWLRLWTMEIDREPVAAWYGYRFGGVESFYQSGRNRDWDRFSVGYLMLMRTIQAAFDDGLDTYAFLRGDEPYKDRLAEADPGLETRAVGRGALGGAVVRTGAPGLKVPWLRRRVTAAMR